MNRGLNQNCNMRRKILQRLIGELKVLAVSRLERACLGKKVKYNNSSTLKQTSYAVQNTLPELTETKNHLTASRPLQLTTRI